MDNSVVSEFKETGSEDLAQLIAQQINHFTDDDEFLTLEPNLLFQIIDKCDPLPVKDTVSLILILYTQRSDTLDVEELVTHFKLSDEDRKMVRRMLNVIPENVSVNNANNNGDGDSNITVAQHVEFLEKKLFNLEEEFKQHIKDMQRFLYDDTSSVSSLSSIQDNISRHTNQIKKIEDIILKDLSMKVDSIKKYQDILLSKINNGHVNNVINQCSPNTKRMDITFENPSYLSIVSTSTKQHKKPRCKSDRDDLFDLIKNNEIEIVRTKVIESPHVVNHKNGFNTTPLHCCALIGSDDLCKLFIDEGGDINAVDNAGCTPINYAAAKGFASTVKLLTLNKADLSIVDSSQRSALHYSVIKGHYQASRVLIEAGAILDLRDNSGKTPLHYSIIKGYQQITELLLKSGASTQIPDNHGKFPENYAHQRSKSRISN